VSMAYGHIRLVISREVSMTAWSTAWILAKLLDRTIDDSDTLTTKEQKSLRYTLAGYVLHADNADETLSQAADRKLQELLRGL